MGAPNIAVGQVALDPYNKVLYYRKLTGEMVSTSLDWLLNGNDYGRMVTGDEVTISNDLIVNGSLTVNGTTTTINAEEVKIEDSILILNSNATGTPLVDGGIEIERGNQTNVQLLWNESENKWQFTNDGITYYDINSIIEDSVTLGYHTVGDYIRNLVAGTGVTIANNSGEGATPSLSIGQPVETNSVVTFSLVNSNLIGNVTGNVTGQVSDISNHAINALIDVDATPSYGEFLKWNGSSWVNDQIDLKADTTGSYVEGLVAGTGVTITNNSGEAATPTIAIGQDVGVSATPTFSRVISNLTGDVTGNVIGDLTGDVTGNVTGDLTGNVTGNLTGDVTGNVTGNVTGDVTGNLTGNVTGEVSDISNHEISDLSNVTILDAADGDFLRYNGASWINDPVNLTTDTVGDYVSKLSAGTGIVVTNNSGEGATPNVSLSANINDLLDVQISTAKNGQLLQFNGTEWVNSVLPTNEPMGHEDRLKSTISFDNVNRRFSISPVSGSHNIWASGIRYVKTSTETIDIPDISGLYYIYYNSSAVLSYKQTFFDLENEAPTAYVYWNSFTQRAEFLADERHGITLDWQTHEYLHRTRGAAIASGFNATNYVTDGNGDLDSDAWIGLTGGTFFDEDIQVDIVHSATPASNSWEQELETKAKVPVFYRQNGNWTKALSDYYVMRIGSLRSVYNSVSLGVWGQTDIGNTKFGIAWLIATNNILEPVIAVMGQAEYLTSSSAEEALWGDMDLGGFPVVEFRPLYKVIFQTSNAYLNANKAAIRGVYDLRREISSGSNIPTIPVSDHGSLTGLSDDDHIQYLLADGTRAAASLTVSGTTSTNRIFVKGIEIDAATPSDTNVLKYSSALNKYIPGVASTVASLDDLTDVVINSATPNQILKFDGTSWVNATAPSGAGGSVYLTTIGNGSSSTFTLTHGLSTRDIVVSFTQANSPYESFTTTWEATTLNTITVYFDSPPTSNSIRVSVYGAVSGVSYPSLSGSMYSGYHGNGLDSMLPVYHGMGTSDVFLQVRNANSPYEIYNVAWEATTNDIATLYFDSPPELNSIYVMVYAALSGVSSTSLEGLTDITFSGLANGDFLRYNGLNWINDPVNLSTDTVGDYVKNLVAGTGITISDNLGEGATPNISVTSNTYQPLDGDLTSIAGLVGASGILKKTNTDTWTLDTSAYLTSLALNQLTNVNAATPSSDQVLAYDTVSAKWISKTFSATVASLDSIGDVIVPSPISGEFLKWNGSAWVNANDVRDNNIRYLMDVI